MILTPTLALIGWKTGIRPGGAPALEGWRVAVTLRFEVEPTTLTTSLTASTAAVAIRAECDRLMRHLSDLAQRPVSRCIQRVVTQVRNQVVPLEVGRAFSHGGSDHAGWVDWHELRERSLV